MEKHKYYTDQERYKHCVRQNLTLQVILGDKRKNTIQIATNESYFFMLYHGRRSS